TESPHEAHGQLSPRAGRKIAGYRDDINQRMVWLRRKLDARSKRVNDPAFHPFHTSWHNLQRLPFCVLEAVKTDKHIPTLLPPWIIAAQVPHHWGDSAVQR